MSLVINNVTIDIRESDGFINATQICKAGGKRFSNWYQLESTKELIKTLEAELNTKVIDVKKGNSKTFIQGSYVHRRLAISLASWISPYFMTKVSKWVEEWAEYDPKNKKEFYHELSNLKPSQCNQKEREIQLELQQKLHGEIEVKTPNGYIDLVTDRLIIEIKELSNWKHALGQILSYGVYYENKRKQLYLFGYDEDSLDINELERIKKTCGVYNVDVIVHDDDQRFHETLK